MILTIFKRAKENLERNKIRIAELVGSITKIVVTTLLIILKLFPRGKAFLICSYFLYTIREIESVLAEKGKKK